MKRLFTFMLAMVSAFTIAGTLLGVRAQETSGKENVYFNEYGQSMGRTINFDDNWRFYFGDAKGAEGKDYDDSRWRNINLPHDYSIEQEFTRKNGNEGESGYLGGGVGWYRKTFKLDEDYFKNNLKARIDFDGVYMDSTVYINGTMLGNHPYGYTPFSFDISQYLQKGENTIAVRVNHELPSSRWYSGSGIYRSVHLTLVNPVHVDLFGSKIQTPELAENQNDVKVVAETEVRNTTSASKSVNIKYEFVERQKDGSEGSKLATFENKNVSVGGNATTKVSSTFNVSNPKLWGVDEPNLYYVKTTISENGVKLDEYKEQFGFRYTKFDPKLGFSLNGERMKLKGVSMHHDQGSLGAVANKDAQERQIRLLKEMGANSIRVTHNPASQTLIDAANEMGILLIEEAFDGWNVLKNGNHKDYSRFFNKQIEDSNKIYGKEGTTVWHEFDLKMQIKRGVNAPSIIAWSLGNEIWEGVPGGTRNDWVGIHKKMIEYVETLDTSRPVTTGDNHLKHGNRDSIAIADQNANAGGLVGFNYASGSKIDEYHNSHPNWPIYASETSSAINSRGVYYIDHKRKDYKMELTSYDTSTVGWGLVSSASWDIVQRRDYVAGEYIWTGFDYLGEPTDWNETGTNPNGPWPTPKNSFFGILDTAGLPKDRYYFYQSQWLENNTTLHVLPAWDKDTLNVKDGQEVRVDVYSNAAKVELYLETAEGKKLIDTSTMKEFRSNATTANDGQGHYTYMARGEGRSHTDLYHTFRVPYADGTLSAVAYDEDDHVIEKTTGISSRTTTGEAYKIKATVEEEYNTITADNKSLAYIRLDVVDSKGNIVPNANHMISTKVSGDGRFISMDNGEQKDVSKFSNPERRAYNGSEIAIVGATNTAGKMTVKFTAPGLQSAEVVINTIPSKNPSNPDEVIGLSLARSYFLKKGDELQLPNEAEVIYGDGRKETKSVVWTNLNQDDFKTTGLKKVNGKVDNKYNVTINVNVVDKIAGVFTYTAAGLYGETPRLPETLEAFDGEGNGLGVFLQMKWEMPSPKAFEKYGEIKIKGTSSFLGFDVETYATISIRKFKEKYEGNVAPYALTKTQDDKDPSDDFESLFNVNNNPNSGYWSNYKSSINHGDTDTVIKLEYATAQKVGKLDITFIRDSFSLVYPEASSLTIQYLEGSEDESSVWNDLTYKTPNVSGEKRASDNSQFYFKKYSYEFEKPINMTVIKFTINNNSTGINGRKAVTGASEVELISVMDYQDVGSQASLSELKINGNALTASELKANSYNVSYTNEAIIEAKGTMNAAVTVLPKVGNKQIIQIVSEDKITRREFVINYGKESLIDPNFSGGDYKNFSKITAPQAQSSHGLTTDKMVDDKPGTHYHSSWGADLKLGEATTNNELVFELAEAKNISAVRYLPRPGEDWNAGERNGRVSKYEIHIDSGDGVFHKVTEGSWANNDSWKIAQFNDTLAKKVKMVVRGSYGDNGLNKYINCAEFRVVETSKIVRNDISTANISVEPSKDLTNPMINVTLVDKLLSRNHDYTVEFTPTTQGKAKAVVTGINNYSGTAELEFDLLTDLAVGSVELVGLSKEAYVGDVIRLADLKLNVTYSDGKEFTINDPRNLGSRLVLISGFDQGLKDGYNQLTFSLDGKRIELSIFAMRGNLDKALEDALAKYDVNLSFYEETNKAEFESKLAALKELKETTLDRATLMTKISETETAFNKLVLKKNAFSSVEAKASLVIDYNTSTLEAATLKLRFGGRVDGNLIDTAKEYGVIVVATNSQADMELVSNMNADSLESLKAKGLAYAMKPVKVDENNYQFAWVINNIPREKYDFEFKAVLYEKDSTGNVVLSKEKVASVNDVVNTYVTEAEALKLPAEIVEVLKKLQKNQAIGE